MLDQTSNLPQSASEILGDLTNLARQLAGPPGLNQLTVTGGMLTASRVCSLATLRQFLSTYATAVLVPHELPAVTRAYGFAQRNELRELVALDEELRNVPALRLLAEASRNVGRMQLRRLRPLRGTRLIQRYLEAVDRGEACGWHTLVYGLVLSVYSLPLRQGLVHFAHQTLGGFVDSSAPRLQISDAQRQQLLAEHAGTVRSATDSVIMQHSSTPFVAG
jgi:urease accessory protein UreF